MEVEEKCKKEEEKKLLQQSEAHEKKVKELESCIDEQIQQKVAAEEETQRIKEMKGKVEDKLKNTAAAFQNFIDTTRGFNKGQADFLILDPLKDESWKKILPTDREHVNIKFTFCLEFYIVSTILYILVVLF